MLDAPITGNVVTAGNGSLGIMCSGPLAAFEHARPVMHDLASATVLYLGEQTGKAQTLKLLNNLQSATGMASACEAFLLGVKAGLDPERMLEVINAGEASSSASRNKFRQAVLQRRFDFGARMAITAKDISLSIGEAEDLGVPMWVGQAVRQVWKFAVAQGGGELDGTSLITFLEPWAGVEVRARGAVVERVLDGELPPFEPCLLACERSIAASIGERLRQQGWNVQCIEAGQAMRAGSLGERACTLLVLPDASTPDVVLDAIRSAVRGPGLVLNACLMARADAARVGRALADAGHACLDVLFAGRARDIRGGNGAIVTSGPVEARDAAGALLADLGQPVLQVGARHGDAHLMQQINGALGATLLASACEAYTAGVKAELDPLTMMRIMGIETGRNAASAHILPHQVATRRFDHGRALAQPCRELELLAAEAAQSGITPWILDRTRLVLRMAAQAIGSGEDVSRLACLYEAWARTEIRTDAAAAAPASSA